MKIISIALLLVIFSNSYAQNDFFEPVFTASAATGFPNTGYNLDFDGFDRRTRFTVGGIATADMGFLRRFSIGFGLGFHQHKQFYSDYSYTNVSGDFIEETAYLYHRGLTIGARGLIHILPVYEETGLDLYWGIGYYGTFAELTSTSTDPKFTSGMNRTFYSPAIIGGLRFYPYDEAFGMTLEVAFPTNYLVSFGVSYRVFQ